MKVRLHQIAHARAGDKGDALMISVIAYRSQDYALLKSQLTVQSIIDHFTAVNLVVVERYEAPMLEALNFVLYGALMGGVTRSLALDAHGKSMSSCLLELELDVPA